MLHELQLRKLDAQANLYKIQSEMLALETEKRITEQYLKDIEEMIILNVELSKNT